MLNSFLSLAILLTFIGSLILATASLIVDVSFGHKNFIYFILIATSKVATYEEDSFSLSLM